MSPTYRVDLYGGPQQDPLFRIDLERDSPGAAVTAALEAYGDPDALGGPIDCIYVEIA